MPDISLERSHRLGLTRARALAWQWAEQAEEKFGMECTVEEGEDEDIVHFTRSGVRGTLRVSGDCFALDARLGVLLGAFSKTIEAEIEKNLDGLLLAEKKSAHGKAAGTKAAATKAPAAKGTRRKG